jgi:HipA-like protein
VFSILQVDPDNLVGDEQLGSKSKFWFSYENALWLFKQARENTGEDWAEKVASEIAKRVGVEAAKVELARYLDHRGSASLSFVAKEENLVHGNEILGGQIFGYDRQKKLKQSDHTFANIVAAVSNLVEGADWYHEILKDLARYIVLDALICNTDRHHENWGFLMTYQPVDSENVNVQLKMAPSFDHASSLGRELLPKRANKILSANGMVAYARNGRGGIYWEQSDSRGVNPLQLVELASSKFPDYFSDALTDVANTPVQDLLDIVDKVPNIVIAEPSRQFAKTLLAYTHGVLSGLAK